MHLDRDDLSFQLYCFFYTRKSKTDRVIRISRGSIRICGCEREASRTHLSRATCSHPQIRGFTKAIPEKPTDSYTADCLYGSKLKLCLVRTRADTMRMSLLVII
jgi:hypothetical protein